MLLIHFNNSQGHFWNPNEVGFIMTNKYGKFSKTWTIFRTCLWNFKFHIHFESWTWLGFQSWIIFYGNLTMLIMMTWPLAWDYCSMILGVLQISSTTRNLVPRFKRWSKGERLGKDGAQHKIGTWGLSQWTWHRGISRVEIQGSHREQGEVQ